MSDLRLPSWICAVPLCRVTHTVEEALGELYQRNASQVVLTTHQNHAFALLHLKDLLWGLAARVLRLEQDLATVPLHQPLSLLLLTEQSPQKAWWTVWQRLGNSDLQTSALDYGFINLEGNFLGVLDYSKFLNRLVDYCPGNPLQGSVRSNLEGSPDPSTVESDSDPFSNAPFSNALQCQLATVFLDYSSALIQENQRLLLENQYKVILLDRLGHDLKTPLTSIVGLASLLKEMGAVLPPQNSPVDFAQGEAIVQHANRQGYYGEIIYQNSRYLMDLVNRLLELARLENQQKVLNPRYIELQPLLEYCWSKAQDAAELRAMPHAVSPYPPCPSVDPTLQIWGDQESCELLLTLFLTHGLEVKATNRHLSLTAIAWGEPHSAWLILHLNLMESEALESTFDFVDGCPVSAAPLEPLNFWIARRFAQWQGGDLNAFGSTLALILPQTPRPLEISNADAPDSSFVLIGLSNPQDWLRGDPLTPLVDQLKVAGIFTLFATDTEELMSKWNRFRPATLLLDRTWADAWETLSLHCALHAHLDPVSQRTILGIALESAPERSPSQKSAQKPTHKSPHKSAHKFAQKPVLPQHELAQDCFGLPHDSQRLWAYLRDQRGTSPVSSYVPVTYDPLALPSTDTLLWLGQSSPDAKFASLFPGCQVLEAEDVEQAELLVQIWDIQAIVVGMVPLEEGEAIVRSIRQSEFLAPLRLIFLSELQIPLLI